jgi:WhiB family redox-sensing transcriptional regulator
MSEHEWMEQARCREVGLHVFFPEVMPPQEMTATIKAAKRVCARCEVINECLAFGINEQHGVWGGTTPEERRRLRRHARAVA